MHSAVPGDVDEADQQFVVVSPDMPEAPLQDSGKAWMPLVPPCFQPQPLHFRLVGERVCHILDHGHRLFTDLTMPCSRGREVPNALKGYSKFWH